MKFLSVLVITVLYGNWLGTHPLRDGLSPRGWFRFVTGITGPGLPGYLVAVVLPGLLLMIIFGELRDSWLGLFYLLLGLLVLLYSIDFVDIDVRFDDHALWLRTVTEADDLEQLAQSQSAFRARIGYEVFRSVMAVVFFFLLLGPGGAVFYALTLAWRREFDDEDESQDADRDLVDQVLYYLEWVPTRITVLIFALFGDFSHTFEVFVEAVGDFDDDNALVLGDALCVAVSEPSAPVVTTPADFQEQAHVELVKLKALLERSLWGWVGVAALLTILGF